MLKLQFCRSAITSKSILDSGWGVIPVQIPYMIQNRIPPDRVQKYLKMQDKIP